MIPGAAKYECDETDDDERGLLEVYPMGNGDWYMTLGYAESKMALEKGLGFPPSVRFRTSGGSHTLAVILCVAILYDIGRGKLDDALHRAECLVRALKPGEHGRDLYHDWPEPED